MLKGFANPACKSRGVCSVDDAVIVGQGDGHHGAGHECAVDVHGFHARAGYAEDRDFGCVDDRGE